MKKIDYVINQRGNDIYTIDPKFTDSSLPKLPVGVYILKQSQTGEFFMERKGDRFEFPFKKYPIDDEFISYVLKRYPSMKKNFGILLNGSKGAGKSVISKTIANELNLPIIIVGTNFPNLGEDFISRWNQPICFFFDEFEKTFSNGFPISINQDDDEDDDDYRNKKKSSTAGESLLPILDGVFSTDIPHVFLFTTNVLSINPNLLSRPGRILYSRTYKNLDPSIVKSFIKDNLGYPEYEEELLKEVSQLKVITIDIVKAIVDEVNIMGVSPSKALEYLNVEKTGIIVPYYVMDCDQECTISMEEFQSVVNDKTLNIISRCCSGRGGLRRGGRIAHIECDDFEERDGKSKKKEKTEEDLISEKVYSWEVQCGSVNSRYARNFVLPKKAKPADVISLYGYDYMVLEVFEGGKYMKIQKIECGSEACSLIYFPKLEGDVIGSSIKY